MRCLDLSGGLDCSEPLQLVANEIAREGQHATHEAHRGKENVMAYLRVDKLHAGDVLLVNSPGKASDLIVKATGGPYSHAALYAGGLRLFEALTTGVAYTRLPLVKVEVHDDGIWRQFCDITAYERMDVLRVPEIARPSDYGTYAFQRRFSDLLWEYNGLDYSKLTRLAKAAAIGRTLPQFSALVMQVLGTVALGDSRKVLPGPFCSELVVEALTQAGFGLLAKHRDASSVSPSDLSDLSVTTLVPVEGCFEELNDAISPDLEKQQMIENIPWPDSGHVGRVRRQSKRIQDFLDRFPPKDG